MIHRTAGARGGYLVIALHLLHRYLGISWEVTVESSHLHIASSPTRTGNLWFPSAKSLVIKLRALESPVKLFEDKFHELMHMSALPMMQNHF